MVFGLLISGPAVRARAAPAHFRVHARAARSRRYRCIVATPARLKTSILRRGRGIRAGGAAVADARASNKRPPLSDLPPL